MPLKKGDFILLDYTAKIKETGETFDTTNEETAKKEKIHKEGEIYEPKLIVIGEGWVLKPLDDALSALRLDKPKTIEIPPDKAFGPRDPQKMKMIPLKRLRDKSITPQIGMRIEYDQKPATIRTIGAGRVTLDFNPPLAGKTLVYEMAATKKLTTSQEKIHALIHRRIPLVDMAKIKLNIKKTDVTIHIPEEAFYIEGLQLAKRGIATDIHRFSPTIAKVEFVETFKNPKPEPHKKSPKGKGTRQTKGKKKPGAK